MHHMPTTRHPHTRAALISSAGHYPARLSATQWSQTHSGSSQRLSGVVAHASCVQAIRSGQPTGGSARKTAQVTFRSRLAYILIGISHRVFGATKGSCKYCLDAHSDCRNGFGRVELPRGYLGGVSLLLGHSLIGNPTRF